MQLRHLSLALLPVSGLLGCSHPSNPDCGASPVEFCESFRQLSSVLTEEERQITSFQRVPNAIDAERLLKHVGEILNLSKSDEVIKVLESHGVTYGRSADGAVLCAYNVWAKDTSIDMTEFLTKGDTRCWLPRPVVDIVIPSSEGSR